MKRRLLLVPLSAAVLMAAATGVASADKPATTDGFVCPVLGGNGGVRALEMGHGPFAMLGEGDLTISGLPNVTVPVHATNDDGAGVPSGPYARPGDPGYGAIWAGD